MIEPYKLHQLSGGQKRRKLALTFGALERDIAGIPEKGMEYNFKNMPRADYTKKIAEIVLEDPKLPQSAAAELKELIATQPFDERRVCNCARNHLLELIGTFPAEWDFNHCSTRKSIRRKRNCKAAQILSWNCSIRRRYPLAF